MSFVHCLSKVLAIEKCADIFKGEFSGWGWGEGVTRKDLSMKEAFIGEGTSQ